MKKAIILFITLFSTALYAQKTDYYEGNLEFKGQKLPLTLEVSIGKDTTHSCNKNSIKKRLFAVFCQIIKSHIQRKNQPNQRYSLRKL